MYMCVCVVYFPPSINKRTCQNIITQIKLYLEHLPGVNQLLPIKIRGSFIVIFFFLLKPALLILLLSPNNLSCQAWIFKLPGKRLTTFPFFLCFVLFTVRKNSPSHWRLEERLGPKVLMGRTLIGSHFHHPAQQENPHQQWGIPDHCPGKPRNTITTVSRY